MTQRHLIIDLEATCGANQSIPRIEMEIIEIGAIITNNDYSKIEDQFQSFIKPINHPILTNFCKNLTSISQETIDAAPLFPEVLSIFKIWLNSYSNFDFCSWGNYDKIQMEQDCQLHGIDFPFFAHHRNIKHEFAIFRKKEKELGLSKALKNIGFSFEGTPHRGLDDAKNIFRILQYMYSQRSKNF